MRTTDKRVMIGNDCHCPHYRIENGLSKFNRKSVKILVKCVPFENTVVKKDKNGNSYDDTRIGWMCPRCNTIYGKDK